MLSKAIVLSFIISIAFGHTCPPEGFDSVKNINITRFVSSPWYIQEQMIVSYQPKETLYCVRASYEIIDPNDLNKGINVYNYANLNEVNGEPYGVPDEGILSYITDLIAIVPDLNDQSKLKVGPKFLYTLFGSYAECFYGDYWIVALGPETSDDSYEWAIVSGGPPTTNTENGCRTGKEGSTDFQVNDIGFWLFAHNQVDDDATQKMRDVAENLGYDLSVLEKVEQKGCLYEDNKKEIIYT